MGTCPVYSVTLRQDGTASWHGEIFTDPLGDAVAYIDGPDFHALAEFVERSGFLLGVELLGQHHLCSWVLAHRRWRRSKQERASDGYP